MTAILHFSQKPQWNFTLKKGTEKLRNLALHKKPRMLKDKRLVIGNPNWAYSLIVKT